MLTGLGDLLRYTHATAIVGDILKMRASDIGLGDMAIVEIGDGEQSLAQVIQQNPLRGGCLLQLAGESKGWSKTNSLLACRQFPMQHRCTSL